MEFIEKVDSANKIIMIQFHGIFEKYTLLPIVKQTRVKALDFNYKIIWDFTDSQLNFSISDAYFWIPNYYDSLDIKLKIVPAAIIPGRKNKKLLDFLETTFINKGAKIRLCKNEEEAKNWILSGDLRAVESSTIARFKNIFQDAC